MAISVYERAGQAIGTKLIPALEQGFISRLLAGIDPDIVGVDVTSFKKFDASHMANADNGYSIPSPRVSNKDSVHIEDTDTAIPAIWKDFKIPRQTFDSFSKGNMNVDLSQWGAKDAGYLVRMEEELRLLQGWKPDGTAYEAKGFYQSATTSEATSKVFSTYGNALAKVSLMKSALGSAGIQKTANFNLMLSTDQSSELESSVSTIGTMEWDQVLLSLNRGAPNGPQGRILTSPDYVVYGMDGEVVSSTVMIADATCFMSIVDPVREYYRIVNPTDMTILIGNDMGGTGLESQGDIIGRVSERVILDVMKPESICVGTNI